MKSIPKQRALLQDASSHEGRKRASTKKKNANRTKNCQIQYQKATWRTHGVKDNPRIGPSRIAVNSIRNRLPKWPQLRVRQEYAINLCKGNASYPLHMLGLKKQRFPRLKWARDKQQWLM